jgi:DNA-binding SARP family transcriptional activator/Tfp pilus assembly protein PilF
MVGWYIRASAHQPGGGRPVSSDQVKLRVLGPVEVNVAGQWVAPGPPKQRALLAALALNAGRTVSIRALIETLWFQDPPASAVKNVQLYVWRLRKWLGGLPQQRPSGYYLPEDSVVVDVSQFADLVRLARRARLAGDNGTASQRFSDALSVWRGPALEDVVAAGIGANLARPLAEERSRVIHELAELELARGRAADMLPRLHNWIAEDPLDERLRELEMQALLDTARPAQALRAYFAAESAMASDLGTDPGPELRRLSAAARHAMGETPQQTVVPQQLPPTITTFVGRHSETSTLVDILRPRVRSVPIAAIVGPGGIGKSCLGIRVAHRLADSFPDGQLYLDLQGATPGLDPLAAIAALSMLLRSLGVAAEKIPHDLADAVRLYRSRTAGLKLLLLLDNAVGVEQLRPLVPGTGGSAVLVTARRNLAELEGLTQLHLGTLATDDAIELVTATIGRSRVTSDEELRRLTDACAGLPLALQLAASRLASRPSWPVAAFNDRLTDERRRLDELRLADVALRSSFAVSYQHLPPKAQHVFRCCGLFPGPDFTPPAIAALARSDESQVCDLLEALVDESLLHSRIPGRYHLHDLMRIYAVDQAHAYEDEHEVTQRLSRLTAWYLRAAADADRTLNAALSRPAPQYDHADLPAAPTYAGQTQAVAWFEAERRNLREVVQTAARHGLHRLAWQLPLIVKGFLDLGRYTDDWIATYETALESVQQCDDPYAQARVLNGLGSGYWRQERAPEAIDCYHRALAIVRGLGDRRTEAILWVNLGGIHGGIREFDAAIDALQRALQIREQVGGQFDETFALTNLGHVYHECGRADEARPLLERALRLRREQGNRHGEAITLHCLADTLLALRHYAEADAAAEQALTMFVEQGNRYGQGVALHTMGRVCAAQELPGAAAHLREAIAVLRDVGASRGAEEAEADLAGINRLPGKPSRDRLADVY